MYKKTGIPRGLYYHRFFPLWKTFFEELGAEIVVSDNTSKRILDNGVKACVDEACLPVKLFFGHVMNLRGRVDCIFIPRLTSISRNEYICPKIGGLPDMVKSSINGLPGIICTEINLRKSDAGLNKAILEIGSNFAGHASKIKRAFKTALINYREYEKKVREGFLPNDAPNGRCGEGVPCTGCAGAEDNPGCMKIALIGHAYILYDSYINMNIIEKFRKRGIGIVTPEMMDRREIERKASELPKKMFWDFGRTGIGAVLHAIERKDIHGIVYLMSFGCGVDSFVSDLAERKARAQGDTPFIILSLDEHSGEAGFNTRLEAFIDMLEWRRAGENNLSTYG